MTIDLSLVASTTLISKSNLTLVPDALKDLITAFAGGGELTMTFQAIIPEVYEEIKDWISIIADVGFAISFMVSHVFH